MNKFDDRELMKTCDAFFESLEESRIVAPLSDEDEIAYNADLDELHDAVANHFNPPSVINILAMIDALPSMNFDEAASIRAQIEKSFPTISDQD